MAKRENISISLTPQQTDFLAKCVASGRYQSTSEVVREGVRLLEDQQRMQAAELDRARALIREGAEQLDRGVRDAFEAALHNLAESPLLGKTNEALDPADHSFRYYPVMKRFIIVYEPSDDGIRVARLLHGARNLAVELDHEPGDN